MKTKVRRNTPKPRTDRNGNAIVRKRDTIRGAQDTANWDEQPGFENYRRMAAEGRTIGR